MKFSYIALCFCSVLYAGELSTKEIRSPSAVVFDITNNTTTQTASETIVAKVAKPVNYVWGYKNRTNMIDNCSVDSSNNQYCPLDLVPCATTESNVNGTAVAMSGTVVDYTAMTGTAYSYDATVNYQYVSYAGSDGSLGSLGIWGLDSGGGFANITFNKTTMATCWKFMDKTGNCVDLVTNIKYTMLTDGENPTGIGAFSLTLGNGAVINENLGGVGHWSKSIPVDFQNYQNTGWDLYNITISCDVGNADRYHYYSFRKGIASCPNGGTLSGSTCNVNTMACPTGYTATTGTETAKGQCKKNVSYLYYNYQCPTTTTTTTYAAKTGSSYTYAATETAPSVCQISVDGGGGNCSTNRPSSGWSYCYIGYGETAAEFAFNSTCTWKYYTANFSTGNLGPYTTGSDGGGNYQLIPPGSAVRYIYSSSYTRNTSQTSLSCPNGGTLSGSTCTVNTLACPAGYVATTGADTANGECKKDTTVALAFTYDVQNSGGCSKVDPSSTVDNTTTLSATCNSSTPPANNCQFVKHTCTSDPLKPCALVGGSYQCSPYACDSDKKCGYGHCPTEFSNTNSSEVTPLSADPLKYTLKSTVCKDLKCDLVNGPYYSMCGKKTCPQGFGVYEKNGSCWKDACPSGSVEINGECIKKN